MSPILARVNRLSPLGPIFAKELRVTSRRRRTYILRVAYLSALLLTLLFTWSTASPSRGTSVAARVQAQAEMGTTFFAVFAAFSVAAMALVGPVLTSTAIGAEKLAKTLPVLLMTPIGNWQIAAGKLFSRLLVSLSLLGLSLPVLAVVRLLGGVEWRDVCIVLAVCVATAVFTASVGLVLSSFMTRAYAVILLSYTFLFLAYFITPILIGLWAGNAFAKMQWIASINPIVALVMLMEQRSRSAGPIPPWAICVVVHLVLSALFLLIAAAILRRISNREAVRGGGESVEPPRVVLGPAQGDAGVVSEPRAVAVSPSVAGEPAGVPGRTARSRRVRDVGDHPVLWHEVRRPLMPNRWQAVVGLVACLGILVAIYWALADSRSFRQVEAQIAFAVILHGIAWLLVSVLSATAIAQEKDSDTWMLLLTTPLSGRAIIWGKALGVLRRLVWPGAIVVAHFLLFTIIGVLSVPTLLLILWIMFSYNMVWLATGIYLSLRVTRVTAAVVLNLLLALCVYAFFPMLLIVLEALFTSSHRSELAEQTNWYQPFFYLTQFVAQDEPRWRRSLRLPDNTEAGAFTFWMTAAIVGVVYLLVAWLMLEWTTRRFDAIVGRAEQLTRLPAARPRADMLPPPQTA